MEESTKRQHYEPGHDRREAIARAARALIVEKGFEGLRMRDIAERVGINIATLHYHIPGKEALIALVTQSIRDDFVAQHLSHPQQTLSALERCKLEFDDFRDTIASKPELHAVFSELIGRARRDEAIRDAIRPMLDKWQAIFAGILKEGQEDGVFRAGMDAEAASGMIVGALMNYGLTIQASVEAIDRLEAEFFRAISAPSTKDIPK